MLYILSPVLLRINPLIDGLTAGPRFPRLLMSARPPGGGPGRQILARQRKKERSRRGDPDDSDGERQDRSDQIPLEQGGCEKTDRRNDDADSKVPSALMPPIRMAANQDHTDDAGGIWDARVDSDQQQILDAPALDQGRYPKHHCVSGAQQKEID